MSHWLSLGLHFFFCRMGTWRGSKAGTVGGREDTRGLYQVSLCLLEDEDRKELGVQVVGKAWRAPGVG